MTKVCRLLASAAVVAALVWWSSSNSQGEPVQRLTSMPARPQAGKAAAKDSEAALAESKFTQDGVLTYRPLEGETFFALQLKPQLEPVPIRNRDYLIMVCTSAAQAGEPFIAAHQIAEAIVETAKPGDRVSLWVVSSPEAT